MTGAIWKSAFVAALFALQPLHVESVAWVSERKDVLSTFFWILSIWAYVRYVRQPDRKRYSLFDPFFRPRPYVKTNACYSAVCIASAGFLAAFPFSIKN